MPRTVTKPTLTFDLTDLCGCPDDCPDCCGVVTVCCGSTSIPRTLYATVALHGMAGACLASIITLIYSDANARWEGSGTVQCGLLCGTTTTIYLRLRCDPSLDFHLLLSCDNFANLSDNTPISLVCDPFDAVFLSGTPGAGCTAGCGGVVANVEVTQ